MLKVVSQQLYLSLGLKRLEEFRLRALALSAFLSLPFLRLQNLIAVCVHVSTFVEAPLALNLMKALRLYQPRRYFPTLLLFCRVHEVVLQSLFPELMSSLMQGPGSVAKRSGFQSTCSFVIAAGLDLALMEAWLLE
jgi:hypothetical protein